MPRGGLGLLEAGEQLADPAQGRHGFLAHAHGYPVGGAEEVAQEGNLRAFGSLEEERRTPSPQGAVADLRDLQVGIDLGADALELPPRLQLGDEIS
jgi:hypothetical protein